MASTPRPRGSHSLWCSSRSRSASSSISGSSVGTTGNDRKQPAVEDDPGRATTISHHRNMRRYSCPNLPRRGREAISGLLAVVAVGLLLPLDELQALKVIGRPSGVSYESFEKAWTVGLVGMVVNDDAPLASRVRRVLDEPACGASAIFCDPSVPLKSADQVVGCYRP